MSLPTIQRRGSIWALNWAPELITAQVSHLRNHRDRMTAEIAFASTAPGKAGHIYSANLNLDAPRSRTEFAKELNERWEVLSLGDWKSLLDQVCEMVKAMVRAGEPAIEIHADSGEQEPRDFIHPLLPWHKPSVLFGDGASYKSWIALLLSGIAYLPWEDNPLGLISRKESHKTLYLDWEGDKEDQAWRLRMIRNGMEKCWPVYHRRCYLPLIDDFDSIQRQVIQTEASFLVVDSAILACGKSEGDPAGPVTEMMTAIRELQVTCLIITHVAATDRSPSSHPKAYGSIFWRNLARSAWEVRKSSETDRNVGEVMLIHNKANFSESHDPIGLRFEFGPDSLTVHRKSALEIDDLAKDISLPKRILFLLERETGGLKREEICDELRVTEKELKMPLWRLEKIGRIGKTNLVYRRLHDTA